MSVISFNVSTNSQQLVAKFGRMAERLADPKPVLEAAMRILQAQEAEVWATEGRTIGEAWNALVQPERKVGAQMLVESGALRSSMATGGSIRGATLRIKPTPFYAKMHQFGTHTMDARPFSGISDSAMRLITMEFQEATGRDLGV